MIVRGINRDCYQWQTLLRRVLRMPSALRCKMKGTMRREIQSSSGRGIDLAFTFAVLASESPWSVKQFVGS